MKRKTTAGNKAIAGLLFAAILLVAFAPAQGLLAQPSDLASKSQQAAEIARQIDALDNELEIASDAYNRVKVDLDAITSKVEETRSRLTQIKETLRKRRIILNKRAATMYKNGRTSMFEVLLRTRDFVEFLEQADYVSKLADSDAELITRIKSTRDSVAMLESQLAEQQRQQEGLVAQAAAKKSGVEQKLGERQALLNSVNQDIQRLLAEQARIQAVTDAALNQPAEQTLADIPEGSLAKTCMRYLGVVYHWAGEGPGRCPTGVHRICFDCSGLMQYVYKLHGIKIPRTADVQFYHGIKVSRDKARPGDMVFFGSPIHHVGMYIGNDMFIHAPRTGDVVKITKLSSRSDVAGFARYAR
ncbi:MAG: C40 family peptidase [Actinobacteria bacterium]|nr:C40 family peptidase [Actinomycetota bacterium]